MTARVSRLVLVRPAMPEWRADLRPERPVLPCPPAGDEPVRSPRGMGGAGVAVPPDLVDVHPAAARRTGAAA